MDFFKSVLTYSFSIVGLGNILVYRYYRNFFFAAIMNIVYFLIMQYLLHHASWLCGLAHVLMSGLIKKKNTSSPILEHFHLKASVEGVI